MLADGRRTPLDRRLIASEEFASHVEGDRWKVEQCADLFTELAQAVAESGLCSAASDALIIESIRVSEGLKRGLYKQRFV